MASVAVGLPSVRKKRSLPPMRRSTAAMSDDGASTATTAGDSSRAPGRERRAVRADAP
jgi:hypothetical protein